MNLALQSAYVLNRPPVAAFLAGTELDDGSDNEAGKTEGAGQPDIGLHQ